MSPRLLTHEAELQLAPGSDRRAPGAAVTVALCGHWEHDGSCRRPHLTDTDRRGAGRVSLRTRVLVPPGDDPDDVRRMLVTALRTGILDGPEGHHAWRVLSDAPGAVTPDDEAWAALQTPV